LLVDGVAAELGAEVELDEVAEDDEAVFFIVDALAIFLQR
jgi:hypothetical protein